MEQELDFDYLCELNKSNPEEFEALRKELIENAIKSARSTSQQRLRGLQFKVDATRQIHKNAPFVACMEVSKIMHQSFNELRCRLNDALDVDGFSSQASEHTPPASSQKGENVVLSFKRKS